MLRISSSTTPYMPYVSQRPPYFFKKIWCENGMKSKIVFLESRPQCRLYFLREIKLSLRQIISNGQGKRSLISRERCKRTLWINSQNPRSGKNHFTEKPLKRLFGKFQIHNSLFSLCFPTVHINATKTTMKER